MEKQNVDCMTKTEHASAIADDVMSTGLNLKWDHIDWYTCTSKRSVRYTLQDKVDSATVIGELKPTLNDNANSKKLYLYYW